MQRFDYVVSDEFLLRSYEIKRSDTVDKDAAAEAASHKRIAQLAYLVIVPHGDDARIFDPTDSRRRSIERECLKAGVGLILISDYAADAGLELVLEALNTNLDNREVNSTIGRFFSEPKRDEVKTLISRKRSEFARSFANLLVEQILDGAITK